MYKREITTVTTVTTKNNSLCITMESIPFGGTFYYNTKTISNNKVTCDLSDSQGNKIKDLPGNFNFTQEEIHDFQNNFLLTNVDTSASVH